MSGWKQITFFAVLVGVSAVVGVSAALERERREDCAAQFSEYSSCVAQAASGLSSVGPDGRPDFVERQGCNLLETLMACSKRLTGSCNTPQVQEMRNTQMRSMINSLETLKGWDNEKCLTARSFLNGSSALVGGLVPLAVLLLAQLFV